MTKANDYALRSRDCARSSGMDKTNVGPMAPIKADSQKIDQRVEGRVRLLSHQRMSRAIQHQQYARGAAIP